MKAFDIDPWRACVTQPVAPTSVFISITADTKCVCRFVIAIGDMEGFKCNIVTFCIVFLVCPYSALQLSYNSQVQALVLLENSLVTYSSRHRLTFQK